MRKTIFAAGAILMIATTASGAEAICQPTTSLAETFKVSNGDGGLTLGSGEANTWTFYVVNDACQLDGTCLFSTWIYQEMNGIDGLQRQDMFRDDTCGGMYSGDLIVF